MYKVYYDLSSGTPVLLGTFGLCSDAFLFVDAYNAYYASKISDGCFGCAYWVKESEGNSI